MSMVPVGGVPGRPEGLEDLAPTDMVVPTLRINHKECCFEDSLSGQKYDGISGVTAVLLGLVKQRILWPAELGEEKEQPMCRSYNFTEGHPAFPQEVKVGTGVQHFEKFPWEAAGFEQPADGWQGSPTRLVLPCGSCKLKDWGTHPKRNAPWCSEQHTFAMLLPTDSGALVPVLFQIQRSALKTSKMYLSSFANAGQPLFTVFTKITLIAQKRGSNDYATPKFVRDQGTDESLHPGFSDTYRAIRAYVQTPRGDSEEEETTDETIPEPPAPSTPAPPATPAQPPTPSAPAAPAAPATAPAAPAAPATAPAPPVAPAAPVAAPAPPRPPMPMPAAPTPVAAPADDLDDLPF